MAEYKPNSNKSKREAAERKNVQKVVTGGTKVKKKTGFSKFKDVFLPEDLEGVKSCIIYDVLIPSVKKLASDVFETWLYGENTRSRSRSNSNTSTVSYNKYYGDRDPKRPTRQNANVRNGYDFDDIIFDTRGDAELVLESMDEWLDRYEIVSVGDLYDMSGITCKYTDYNYGWTNIHTATVARVRDGYVIRLPRPIPLN